MYKQIYKNALSQCNEILYQQQKKYFIFLYSLVLLTVRNLISHSLHKLSDLSCISMQTVLKKK